MLAYPYNNKKSVEIYYQERLQTFMLAWISSNIWNDNKYSSFWFTVSTSVDKYSLGQ